MNRHQQRLQLLIVLATCAGVPWHVIDAALIVGTVLYGPKDTFTQEEFDAWMKGSGDDAG